MNQAVMTEVLYKPDDGFVNWADGDPCTGILVHFADGKCVAVDLDHRGRVTGPVLLIPGDTEAEPAPADLVEPASVAAMAAFLAA